jgi:hypothetical protein
MGRRPHRLAVLNSTLIAQIATTAEGHRSWTTINPVNTGFLAGANVLELVVTKVQNPSGNPTGLRTELVSSVSAIPEPSSSALLLVGLGVVGWVARRRLSQR